MENIQIEEGDTDTAPYGLGTYASRSTPTAGAAAAMAARKLRDKAKKIAAHLLEVSEQDLEWEPGKFFVKGAPDKTQGIAPAMYEELIYDESGNILNGTFMDYLVPTAVESPSWETGHTVTPAPHHPIGAKGVGESPTVGAPPAIVNAIVDAVAHLGIKHLEIPVTPFKLFKELQKVGYFEKTA